MFSHHSINRKEFLVFEKASYHLKFLVEEGGVFSVFLPVVGEELQVPGGKPTRTHRGHVWHFIQTQNQEPETLPLTIIPPSCSFGSKQNHFLVCNYIPLNILILTAVVTPSRFNWPLQVAPYRPFFTNSTSSSMQWAGISHELRALCPGRGPADTVRK